MFWCNECDKPFTVTVGTVMEDSHIPLNKWVLALYLMNSSKKGVSAHQLHRTIGITYKSAWFMAHRIREAMATLRSTAAWAGRQGCRGRRNLVGGKAKNRAYREPAPKKVVLTLVERDGRARSFHVANVTAKTLRPIIVKNTSRKSTLMTDEASYSVKMGREFAAIRRSIIRARNTLQAGRANGPRTTRENYFSILKRGVSEPIINQRGPFDRYLAEFDFRYCNRSKLGVEDAERAVKAVRVRKAND